MEDDGTADVTHEWKIPQADNSGVAETHKFVGESKQATLTNKSISADPSQNNITDIYDASIHQDADIQGSKLLDGSVEDVKIVDLDGQKLFAESVDTAQLANDSVTNDKIETLGQDVSGAVVDTDSTQTISNKTFAFDQNSVSIPDNSIDAISNHFINDIELLFHLNLHKVQW